MPVVLFEVKFLGVKS